jgi:hypothetical protein
VVKAVLLAALYPNVAVMDDEAAPGGAAGGGASSIMAQAARIVLPANCTEHGLPCLRS